MGILKYVMQKNIMDENNPIWIDMAESEFTDYLINASDTLDVEKLLLARMTSKNKDIADWAARRLYLAYVFGSLRIGDENVCMGYITLKCKYPDFGKIKALTSKVILDDDDLKNVLYWSQYYKYDIMALEAALIAMGNNAMAKTILYFLYRDGKYIDIIYSADVVIIAPELNTKERYDAFVAENAGFIKEHNLEERKSGEIYDQLQELFELDDEPPFSYWVEEVGISKFALMRLYLFGEYEGLLCLGTDEVYNLTYPEEKNIGKAIALIPSYLAAAYSVDDKEKEEMETLFILWMREKGYDLLKYVADYDLQEFALNMEELGYSQEELNRFVSCFLKEVSSYEKVLESSMRLLICGKPYYHSDSEVLEYKNFEKALEFIPEYIHFFTTDYEKYYLCEGAACLDERLHYIMQDMRELNISEAEQLRFAYAWFKEIESQGKMSLALMAVYLSGRFLYDGYQKRTDVLLSGLKSLEKALSIIPAYITYTLSYSDPAWDDGVGIHLGRMLDRYLLPTMQEAGYEEGEIDIFKTAFLDEIEKQDLLDYFIYDAKEEEDENVIKVVDFSDMPF